MKQYDHSKIEKRWQKEWAKKGTYETSSATDKPKFYILDMFPYPSGEGLHVGHPKGYIATDIVSRMKRMQGFNVLHPMGFDAFGLPAENYAIKTKTNPMDSVAKNVERYKQQLEILGFDYDWSREVNTTDPKFYKWTQWIFLKLLEKGLAYESHEPINWCPSCKTGLANEDVEDGRCERCGTPVEKKPMRQWVLRITDYADRLLKDLDTLDWPESIKESQRNWIGRSEGAEIDFKLKAPAGDIKALRVFTTRPDTLFGVTYVVVAPEHQLVTNLIADKDSIKNRDEVIKYVAAARVMTQIERTDAKKDKTGVKLDGVFAVNPANGEEVPVYVADYVLAEYGTGAVMAVPAHDERDYEFAKRFKLPMKSVVEVLFRKEDGTDAVRPAMPFVERDAALCLIKHWSEDKFLCSKWKSNDWQGFITGGIEGSDDEAVTAVRETAEETGYTSAKHIKTLGRVHTQFYHDVKKVNRFAHFKVTYLELQSGDMQELAAEEKDLHDVVWVPRDKVRDFVNRDDMKAAWDMLVQKDYCFTGDGLLVDSGKFSGQTSAEAKRKITDAVGGKWVVKYKLKEWVFSRQRYWGEPFPVLHDGDTIVPVPEKDLPVELPKVKSYEPTGTGESPLADVEKWVNVKHGGKAMKRETNTMPQWAGSSWYYLRYMDPENKKALVDPKAEKYWNQVDFYVGGAEHATRHLIYARFWHKFLFDIGVVTTAEPFKRLQSVGLIMGEDGRKMSKRFGNVVNPDDIVSTYGADTLRVYEMFMGPFDQAIAWSTGGIMGSRRFIERVWKMREKVVGEKEAKKGAVATLSKEAEVLLNKTIAKVTDDIGAVRHNTAVSALMILSNELDKADSIPQAAYESFLKLLAPFAPHVADELWEGLGNKGSIHQAAWPVADASKLEADEDTIAVQVNGKTRATFKAPKGADKAALEASALALDDVKKWMGDSKPKKVIVVPGRMVSVVA